MSPFLTFYTPTYRRPKALIRCLNSVAAQTAVHRIEQIVIPDHVGVGVGGMFGRIQEYAPFVHGKYVHILCDDDELAAPTVVEQLEQYAEELGYPELIVVDVEKGGARWPIHPPWPPVFGQIDLGCGVIRNDIWKRHAADYKPVYEGDFTFFKALADAGVRAVALPIFFLTGAISRGNPETTE